MSEVTSVNGKSGEVVLKAADVEAIPTAQAGAASGVATLDSGTKLTGAQIPSSVATKTEVTTEKERAEAAEALKIPLSQKGAKSGVAELNEESKLPEAQLPGSVETSSLKALGSISGVHATSFATPGVFTATLTGATEIEPTELPTSPPRQYVLQVKTEGHTFSIKGITWLGPEPKIEGEFAVTLLVIGGVLYGFVGAEGKEGPKGENSKVEAASPFAYAGGTTYTPGKIVGSGGSTYICIKESKGNEPPNATYWALVAEKGTLEVESVTGAEIKKETIENKNLKGQSVSGAKVEAAKAPHAKPAEKGAEANAAGVPKKITFTITGDGSKKEWTGLKHGLETRLLYSVVQVAEAEEPGAVETGATVTPTSASEAKAVFAAAPAKGAVLYITFIG